MTKAEKLMGQKMHNIGCTVVLHKSGEKWTYIDPNKGFDFDRMENFESHGLGIYSDPHGVPYVYYKDDYTCISGTLVATKDLVYSLPVPIVMRDAAIFEVSVVAASIDLTDFCGVLGGTKVQAQQLILGNDVRHLKDYHTIKFEDMDTPCVNQARKYGVAGTARLEVDQLKLVGDEPIADLRDFCRSNNYIKLLDLSEVNLTECSDLSGFCARASVLKELKIGDVNPQADCTYAFYQSGLPSYYTPAALKTNELKKIIGVQSKTPCIYSILDEPILKIAVTNLSEQAMEQLFPQFTCKILPYSRAEDSIDYPYAFLFLRDCTPTAEVEQYLYINYPEIAGQLLHKDMSGVLGTTLQSHAF